MAQIHNAELHLRQDIRSKAKATERLIRYAAHEMEDLDLEDCKELLILCAALIRMKFDLQEGEVL